MFSCDFQLQHGNVFEEGQDVVRWIMGMNRPRDTSKGCVFLKSDLKFL